MTNAEILRIALEQHAIDASCSPEDFTRSENVVVVSKPHPQARRYLELPCFCNLISYGSNIVAAVDERVAAFVQHYISTEHPEWCFETPQVHHLTDEFAKYGYLPGYMSEYWLPDVEVLRPQDCQYGLRLLEQGQFTDLYLPQWSNALSRKRPHLDMLGVGAYDGGTLIGLAGCSADCETMWQIGIDVLPEYRRQGVAAALTSRLALAVLERGKVPFYGCAWANISSARNAIKSGFRPAWVEHTAIAAEKALAGSGSRSLPWEDGDLGAFWAAIDRLLAESELIIDRPAGAQHPRCDLIYPLAYGYLQNTRSPDGGGIDVWRGSLSEPLCDAIICTVDLKKRDSEIKLLLGCSQEEKATVMHFHNQSDLMKGLMMRRKR